jgi:uncharacterized protein with HEPN domain
VQQNRLGARSDVADRKLRAGAGAPAAYELDELPPGLAGPVVAADSAMQGLRQRLFARLTEEMGRTGPAGAVQVCRDEAQAITAAVERARGIVVGRTSHRLRNPGNAPRPWARPHVEAAAGKRADEVGAIALDLGDRVGVLRPIIIDAADPILRYSAGKDLSTFSTDEMAYDAVLRNLQIIGEAAKVVPVAVRQLHSEVDWKGMAGLRDVLAHAYFGLDDEILWDVVTKKVPLLRNQIRRILDQDPPA